MSDQKNRKWASEAERSRSRRAYQRAWRNKRNFERLIDQATVLIIKARKSNELYQKAERELV